MNLKSALLLAGMLSFGLSCVPVKPVAAEAVPVPIPDPTNAEIASPGIELQLNSKQREAIEQISDFAFDQLEAIVTSGLDPEKIDRAKLNQRVDNLRQILPSIRPDEQQLGQLRTILDSARQQLQKQLETGLPAR